MRVDNRLAIEMLKTITERMKRRAEGRERMKLAEERRKDRAKKRGAVEIKRPSIGIINDEDYGSWGIND